MAALLCLSLAAAAPPPAEPTPPAVSVARATHGSIAEAAILTGTLVPREEVLVSPQVEGLAITDILAEEGDLVAAGQVLARLSRDVLDATVAQNAAQGARPAEQVIEGAPRTAERALADAQRRELLVRLARTDLRAPVAGRISRRIARQGAVVMGAGDPLFRIIQDDAVELEADVPEVSLAKLRPGQPAVVTTVGGPRTGRVRLVSPEVNRTTRLGRVRVTVDPTPDNAASGLVIGSFARASVEVARHDGVLVPLSAVLFQRDGAVIQVVRDGLVETRKGQVGLRSGGQAEITGGLQEGDAVVAVSGTFIRGGDRVTAVAAAPGMKAE